MYEVQCLRCDFAAECETLGRVFRLEEVHKADAGERHVLKWESPADSSEAESSSAEGAGGD